MATEWDSFPLADHPLDSHLGGALTGQAAAFEQAGARYGVDPAAIATFESGHGTSRATRVYNNPVQPTGPRSVALNPLSDVGINLISLAGNG